MLGRENINRIAAHTERSAHKIHVVAPILHFHQLRDNGRALLGVPLSQNQAHLRVAFRLSDPVDGRDGRNQNRVAPLKDTFGGRKAHLLDMLVDGCILFDKKISRRNIGLGLVVVVVADKVLDGIIREKIPHFRIKLSRKRFIGRHNQCGNADPGNDIGHGKGLAGPRDPEKRLSRQALFYPLSEFLNRLSLIACRRIRRV